MMKKPEKIVFPRPRRAGWRRAVLMCLSLPPLLVGTFGLTLAYRIYASNRAQAAEQRYAVMAAPRPPQSLLVFGPHCDDETLGAAGLMQRARRNGCDVHVVIFSNGDGFRVGVAREFRELRVSPADCVRYGYERQTETRAALGRLGIPADHITFLGYPDRGLMPMWTSYWSPQAPFRSAFTQADHCPYSDSPIPGGPYCGAAVLESVKRQMAADRPTDIYVTHPSDDHPDHAAASVFVRTALAQLKAAGAPWAQTARLHYYLVHRGDWPVPQGLHEGFPLPPPAQMASLDTHWERLPLTRAETEAKYAAIKRYRSQTEMTGRFLYSFVRQNELFGTLDEDGAQEALARVADGRIRLDGDGREWAGLPPVALDPAGDSVLRAFQESADVTRVFACRDSRFLYVRLDARNRLSRQVRYSVTLRPIVAGAAQPPTVLLSVSPGRPGFSHPVPHLAGASYVWRGHLLEMAVPLSRVGLDRPGPRETLYVAAETRFADVAIDQTGFRGVPCRPAPKSAPKIAAL